MDEKRQAWAWYAEQAGLALFPGVPIDGPPDETNVGVPSSEPGVRDYSEADFEAALSSAERIELIMSWGSVDRPALGNLKAAEAFFKRRWSPQAPVRGVALVKPGGENSNVVPAFRDSGFEVVPVPIVEPPPDQNRRQGGRDPWHSPTSGEDRAIRQLWQDRNCEGWWLAEVPVGRGSPRRIDAVVVGWPDPRQSRQGLDLADLAAAMSDGAEVELIEAKKSLNTSVIGQLEAAKAMFSDEYPGHGDLKLTACVGEADDDKLAWYCEQAGIQVEVLPWD